MPAQTWNQFVKEIQLEKQVSRKEAMKIASPLWQKQKLKKAKSNKKVKVPPTISEFPKIKKHRNKKVTKIGKRVAVPATVAKRASEFGGAIDPHKKVKRGKKRLVKKHTVLQDSHFRFLSRQAGLPL